MNRREFLKLAAAGMCVAPALPLLAQATAPAATEPHAVFDRYFLEILGGFLGNAHKSSPDMVVCDFPDGTKLKGCCSASGKSYVSVARMLPAMAEWIVARRAPDSFDVGGKQVALADIMLGIFQNAFDQKHPDFWGFAPPDKATQRTVESALVGWSLSRLGTDFVARLTAQQRLNIQNWLASCTQVPERKTNHAWFTALNQAARLELARNFPEFKGDENWMLDDLRALDALGEHSAGGWYSDAPDMPIYDYYNFFVFHNFPLLWSRVIGRARYPEWDDRFRKRISLFLENAQYFFAENGAHPLFGRSLIYRWALLSPLILAYQEGLWPHGPGMLRRIVRKSLEYHWKIGAFDSQRGKLRETYSADGNPDIREGYIDNGHPYWCMLSFTFLSLPKEDPFWTAPEQPLPIEQRDFLIRFPGPRMLLCGNGNSGEVRWLLVQSAPRRDYYRDKYIKFAHSSHFPFNILADPAHCPWDQTLVFREIKTGASAGRAGVDSGELLDNGVRTKWWAKLGDWKFQITSEIRLFGEFEQRTHQIAAPKDAIGRVELLEGSYALGLKAEEKYGEQSGEDWKIVRAPTTGAIAAWRVDASRQFSCDESFDPSRRTNVNAIYARMVVIRLRTPLSAERLKLVSLHYASPRPPKTDEILRSATLILAPK